MTGTVATPDCDTFSFYLEDLPRNGVYFPSVVRKAICLRSIHMLRTQFYWMNTFIKPHTFRGLINGPSNDKWNSWSGS